MARDTINTPNTTTHGTITPCTTATATIDARRAATIDRDAYTDGESSGVAVLLDDPQGDEIIAVDMITDGTDDELASCNEPVHAPSGSLEPRRDGPATVWRGKWSDIDWITLGWIGGIHLAALAAPFYFTWSGLAIAVVLAWITGSLGVCLGYHRLLTHGSFATYRPVKWFYAFLGGVSGEGSALVWVANHRKHHAFSDQEGDPHSPRDGGLWAHMLWLFPRHDRAEVDAHVKRWAPDLQRDPGIRFLHNTFLLWHVLIGVALLASGWAWGGLTTGLSWLVWGMAVRMIYVFHVTWFVNSATHIWGYRNYETTDDSTNLWWVGLLAFGEGWHNNHHAYQRMARHGHRWWEIDVTYWAILAMERLGLAWDVVHRIPTPKAARSESLPQPVPQRA